MTPTIVLGKLHKGVVFVWTTFLNFVYPMFCALCGCWVSGNNVACMDCRTNLIVPPPLMLPLKGTCLLRVWAVGDYSGGLKKKIMGKMYGNRAASHQLATLAMSIPEFGPFESDSFCQNAVLVPIPLHWSRQWKRGFNQAEVLAQVYADKTNIEMIHLLKRTRSTAYQAQLSRKDRLTNLAKSFEIDLPYADAEIKKRFKGKHLILVDDVFTTGQTLLHAAKPLLALKPASISAVVIARGC